MFDTSRQYLEALNKKVETMNYLQANFKIY